MNFMMATFLDTVADRLTAEVARVGEEEIQEVRTYFTCESYGNPLCCGVVVDPTWEGGPIIKLVVNHSHKKAQLEQDPLFAGAPSDAKDYQVEMVASAMLALFKVLDQCCPEPQSSAVVALRRYMATHKEQ